MKNLLLIFIILLAGSFVSAQAPFAVDKINEIKLVKSSREDVRRIFASRKFESSDIREYRESVNLNGVGYEFNYSQGKCEGDEPHGINAPEWKVYVVRVLLKRKIRLKDIAPYIARFGAGLSSYRKEKIYSNVDDIYMYHNKDLGIELEVNKGLVREISFIPPKKYYALLCDKKAAKRFSTTNSFFTAPLKERKITPGIDIFPGIGVLDLSQTTITASCPAINSQESKYSNETKIVDVLALAGSYSDTDVLTYHYTVSGGRIIGTGFKVRWDLTGVKPGVYQITATVDDGCGFCGNPKTTRITVLEPRDCPEN